MELGGLYRKIVDNNVPFFISLEVTTSCNLDCVQCYNAYNGAMPTETAIRCMDEASEMGTLFLTVTGGEPFVHPDIWNILSHGVERGFAVLVYTNATMIGEEEAERLKQTGIYRVETTLLGSCDETHDALTRFRGSFEKTLNAIRSLRKRGVGVTVKTPVMKENAGEVDDIKSMVESMGADALASPLIFYKDDRDASPASHRLDDRDLKKFFTRYDINCLEGHHGGYTCNFGRCMCSVRVSGDVTPCIAVPLSSGNVNERSLADIWKNSDLLKLIRGRGQSMPDECRSCKLGEWCIRCEGLSFGEKGRVFEASSEACRMARIRKEVHDGRTEREEKRLQETGNRTD